MEMPFHQQQLGWMQNFVQHRTEFLNPFFLFLNYFDSEYFFFLLIPIIWIGFSARWGIRMFYLFTFNFYFNGLLKMAISWPRPLHDLPELGLLSFKSFGFPSGAAQTSILLGGLLIYYWKNKKAAWPVALAYILLISFSRIYLGVHYPIDLLGGWLVGLLVLFSFIRLIGPIEKLLAAQTLALSLALSLAIPILFLFPVPKYHSILASCLGVAFGIFFSLRNRLYLPPPKTILEAALRSAIALSTLFLIFFFWPHALLPYAKSFVLSLWLTLGVSPLCRSLAK